MPEPLHYRGPEQPKPWLKWVVYSLFIASLLAFGIFITMAYRWISA